MWDPSSLDMPVLDTDMFVVKPASLEVSSAAECKLSSYHQVCGGCVNTGLLTVNSGPSGQDAETDNAAHDHTHLHCMQNWMFDA